MLAPVYSSILLVGSLFDVSNQDLAATEEAGQIETTLYPCLLRVNSRLSEITKAQT